MTLILPDLFSGLKSPLLNLFLDSWHVFSSYFVKKFIVDQVEANSGRFCSKEIVTMYESFHWNLLLQLKIKSKMKK